MELDRNALKQQALLERVASLTAEYENKVAELRVDFTVVSEQLREANDKLANLENGDEAEGVLEKTSADVTTDK
jgi:uncharacterized protein YpuA (DUF1002 family)